MDDRALTPAKNPPVSMTAPRARPLPVGRAAQDKLEIFGLEAVCERIMAGDSQAVIARVLGVSRSSLAGWLANLRGEEAALYAESMRVSAENLLDDACAILEAAEPTTASVMKARNIADLLVKKAGFRNKAFRERVESGVTLVPVDTGQAQPPQVPVFQIVIFPQREDLGRTIDHDPDG
jgi:hypothetical protein